MVTENILLNFETKGDVATIIDSLQIFNNLNAVITKLDSTLSTFVNKFNSFGKNIDNTKFRTKNTTVELDKLSQVLRGMNFASSLGKGAVNLDIMDDKIGYILDELGPFETIFKKSFNTQQVKKLNDELSNTKTILSKGQELGKLAGKGIDVSSELEKLKEASDFLGVNRDIIVDSFESGLKSVNRYKNSLKNTSSETVKYQNHLKETQRQLDTTFGSQKQITEQFSPFVSRLAESGNKLNNGLYDNKAQSLIDSVTQIDNLGKSFDSLGGVMSMPIEQWQRFNKQGGKFNTRGAQIGNNIRMMTHGLRGFKMELLGIMFFGMSMNKMFMGFLQPAMEAFGIMDLWKTMLLVLFIPIMEKLLPYFLDLIDYFMNLDDDTKLLIGTVVVFGAVLGALLMVIGQVGLGIGSLILGFPMLFSWVGVLLVGAFIALIGIIELFQGKWQGLGLVIMSIGIVLAIVIGWWALIPIAVGAAVYLVAKHWSSIKQFFIQLWYDIKKIFLEGIQWIIDKVVFNPFVKWMIDKKYGEGTSDLWQQATEDVLDNKIGMIEWEAEAQQGLYEFKKGLDDSNNKSNSVFSNILNKFNTIPDGIDMGTKEITQSYSQSTELQSGIWKDTLDLQLESTKQYVQDTNFELSKIGNTSLTNIDKPITPERNILQSTLDDMRGISTIYEPTKPSFNQGTMSWDNLGGTNGWKPVVINQTNNISGSNKTEFASMINDNNKKLLNEVKRSVNQ